MAVIPTINNGDPANDTWPDAVTSALTAYGCILLRTGDQTISDATDTPVTFPTGSVTEVLDTHSFHDGGTNTARITIPTGGDAWYDVGGCVEFAANATGHRQVWLEVGGVEVKGSRVTNAAFGTVNNRMATPTMYLLLAATNYVTLNVRQSSTGNLAIKADGVRLACVRRWPA